MGWLQNWRRQHRLKHQAIAPGLWEDVAASLPLFEGLAADELDRLRELASLFLLEKSLEPMRGLTLSERMKIVVAAQAVLPVLNLGIDSYDHWTSLVLYPDEFVTRHEWVDEDGLVHARRDILSGEAWERGPLVLSWADVVEAPEIDGYNPVIHECAHKLDLLNGSANGMPPLHAGMDAAVWRQVFSTAYDDMVRRVDSGEETLIDTYATESPAEFFAVLSEHFFEIPHVLLAECPEVYQQMVLFYRQQPAGRLSAIR